jgi:thioredoxin 1
MMKEDKKLEKIKLKKLREMMKRGASKKEQRESVLNKPVDLTDTTFTEIVQKYSLVIVDCWAPWCGPCHIIAPIIMEMARDYAGKILFGKLNVDENRKVVMQYQIMSIPTLLIFKNGNMVDRLIGAMPRHMLEPRITRHL